MLTPQSYLTNQIKIILIDLAFYVAAFCEYTIFAHCALNFQALNKLEINQMLTSALSWNEQFHSI